MGDKRPTPDHYLRTNASEWSPAVALFVDTETRPVEIPTGTVETLRLWVARRVDRRVLRAPGAATEGHRGHTAAELADWIDATLQGRRSAWMFAHNLGFDLTVTRLIDRLAERGWTLGDWAIGDRTTWMRLRNGDRGLTLADSWSWLGRPLADVGERLGRRKLPLPAIDAPDQEWFARCAQDVAIMASAMLGLMDWWDRKQMGHWSLTGAGCGWNAMRHRLPEKAIVVKADQEGRDHDRAAIYGGRRDICRAGELAGGPWVTLDIELAYPTVAANMLLPAKRGAWHDGDTLAARYLHTPTWGAVAEVEVETATPRYPLRWGKRTWYPVGRFRTVLCSPEILEAERLGDLVAIHGGHAHQLRGYLAPWGAWVTDLAQGRIRGVPRVAPMVAKGWSRSVLGKFAGKTGTREDLGPAMWPGWHSELASDRTAGRRATLVDMAGRRTLVTQDADAADAYPAVYGFVESHVRVAVNRALDWLGEGVWVQCDTDGVLIDAREAARRLGAGSNGRWSDSQALRVASAVCDRLGPLVAPFVMRPKAIYHTLSIAGPQHYVHDGGHKLSGVSRRAVVSGDGVARGQLWSRMAWQMEHGDRRGFVVRRGEWRVPTATAQRWLTWDGLALPPVAELDAWGDSEVLPWSRTAERHGWPILGADQSAAVQRLRD